jgi:large subunit ribosomal protein L17
MEPMKEDQAPSAILELVDGPKDMRFAMTARTLARLEYEGKELNEMTQRNVEKVTQFREGGEHTLRDMVERMKGLAVKDRTEPIEKKWVYHTHDTDIREKQKQIKKKPNLFLV